MLLVLKKECFHIYQIMEFDLHYEKRRFHLHFLHLMINQLVSSFFSLLRKQFVDSHQAAEILDPVLHEQADGVAPGNPRVLQCPGKSVGLTIELTPRSFFALEGDCHMMRQFFGLLLDSHGNTVSRGGGPGLNHAG